MNKINSDLSYPSYPYPSYPNPVYPQYPQYPQYPVYPGQMMHTGLPQYPIDPYMMNQAPIQRSYKTDSVVQTEPIMPRKKPENQYEFNQLYKKPLNSFEFNDFREKTLPMIRINKIKKIQALARGWYTRKFILPYKRRVQFYAKRVVQDLVDDYIEDVMLPDIILEIINTNFAYKDYSLYAPDFRIIMQIADGIEAKVIHSLCEEAVKEISRFMVNDYLRKRNEELVVNKQFDPLDRVTHEFIEIVIDKEIRSLVPLVIREEAGDYLLESKVLALLNNQFIPLICREVINEAAWEIAEENYFYENFEIIIDQIINDIIIDSAEGEKDRVDLETLENAFNGFLQRSIMKEAINELMLLNKEYHDDEFIKQHIEKVSDDDMSQFAMDDYDDFYKPQSKINPKKSNPSPNSSGRSEIYVDNSGFSNERPSPGLNSKQTLPNKSQVSPEKQNIPRQEYSSKPDYQMPSGFTAPKSPRNKRHPAAAVEPNPVSHGRKGTETFYKE